jgi:hypothetical protein
MTISKNVIAEVALAAAKNDPKHFILLGAILSEDHFYPEDFLIEVVRANWRMLEYINDPSIKVRLAAIDSIQQNDPFIAQDWLERVFKHFNSEDEQLAIVNKMPFAVLALPSPSRLVKVTALEKQPQLIAHLNNPDKELVDLAISKDKFAEFLITLKLT